MSDDVVYASNTALFTLKGNIAVEYLDGQVLEGEFATQDAYNIFLKVDGQPVMIPRQQIRFIKGVQGQQIEADTSQEIVPEIVDRANTDEISTQPVPEPSAKPTEPEIPALPSIPPMEENEDDGTFILTADIDELLQDVAIENDEYDEDDDDDDDTLVIVQDTGSNIDDNEEEFGTVILETKDEMPAVSESAEEEDVELDLTVMLNDSLELDEESGESEGSVTASLVCIAGPHVGDILPLKQGIISIGRSSDNGLVLSNDKEISRHHAIVLHESGKYVVQDQNSLNGSFVNDEQITGPRYLENGDIILVGVSTLKYQEE